MKIPDFENPYFYHKGICELAKVLKGDEKVYLGIRPYGFHAGNAVTLVIYPILLCRELKKLGKVPRFTFYVFLNDWEQESLDGPNPKLYPFNVLPKFTTWQYMKDPIDNERTIVDFWETVIVNNVKIIKHYFPKVKIIPRRNSEMKNYPEMRECILKTLSNQKLILKALEHNTKVRILNSPIIFASAVCPNCHAARGKTIVIDKNKIYHECKMCKKINEGEYEDFDYWFYHKPLALPRIAAFNIDLCITGSDHFKEGDFEVRKKLFEIYGIKTPVPKTLYSSSIFGGNKKIMGKSKGNAKLIDYDKLINLVMRHKNDKHIYIPNKI